MTDLKLVEQKFNIINIDGEKATVSHLKIAELTESNPKDVLNNLIDKYKEQLESTGEALFFEKIVANNNELQGVPKRIAHLTEFQATLATMTSVDVLTLLNSNRDNALELKELHRYIGTNFAEKIGVNITPIYLGDNKEGALTFQLTYTEDLLTNLIDKYVEQLESAGDKLSFENAPESSGGKPKRIAHLTEFQATLLVTFMRNSEIVVKFKTKLVTEFMRFKEALYSNTPTIYLNQCFKD